jgi:hypothetical protein
MGIAAMRIQVSASAMLKRFAIALCHCPLSVT